MGVICQKGQIRIVVFVRCCYGNATVRLAVFSITTTEVFTLNPNYCNRRSLLVYYENYTIKLTPNSLIAAFPSFLIFPTSPTIALIFKKDAAFLCDLPQPRIYAVFIHSRYLPVKFIRPLILLHTHAFIILACESCRRPFFVGRDIFLLSCGWHYRNLCVLSATRDRNPIIFVKTSGVFTFTRIYYIANP